MWRPLLVVVSGAPATGKTTLAIRLAQELQLPALLRDVIKEALCDTLGAPDRARSRELGAASYAVLYRVLTVLIEGGSGAVVESNFRCGQSEDGLRPQVERARSVLIHCQADAAEITRRYTNRERHPGHHDRAALPELLQDLKAGAFEPLDLEVPVLRVDTTAGYRPRPETIVDFVTSRAR